MCVYLFRVNYYVLTQVVRPRHLLNPAQEIPLDNDKQVNPPLNPTYYLTPHCIINIVKN